MLENKNINITHRTIGLLTFCLYLFMSFNAFDTLLIPTVFSQITLYLFFGVGVLYYVFNTNVIRISGFSVWYLIFIVFCIVTTLYSPEKALFSGTMYVLYVAFILSFLVYAFIISNKDLKVVFWTMSLSATFLCLTLAFSGLLVGDAENRLGGEIFGNANSFAFVLMLAVFSQMWLLTYDSNKILTRLILIASIILNMYALSLSGGRKFFIVPFVFLYILYVMKKDKKGRNHFIINSVLIFAIVAIVYYLIMNVEVLYNGVGIRLEQLISGIDGTGELDSSAEIRGKLQSIALEKWTENPIFGYGFDSFKYYSKEVTGIFYYSHCNFTEILYNGGILGFIIYYSFYFIVLRKAIRDNNIPLKYRALAISTIVSMLIFEYGAVTYSANIVILFLVIVYKALSINYESENDKLYE